MTPYTANIQCTYNKYAALHAARYIIIEFSPSKSVSVNRFTALANKSLWKLPASCVAVLCERS